MIVRTKAMTMSGPPKGSHRQYGKFGEKYEVKTIEKSGTLPAVMWWDVSK
jgi:hypothetical protein